MLLWLAAACLLATMFFSAAEMAFIAANRLRLRHAAEAGSRTRRATSRPSASPSERSPPR